MRLIDAQGDEEDEREDRQKRVDRVAAEHVPEDQRRGAHRAQVGEHDRREQEQRGDKRAQQHDQHAEDHEQHERRDHEQVAVLGHPLVAEPRRAVTDQHREPRRDVRHRRPDLVHHRLCLRPERIARQHERQPCDSPVPRALRGGGEDVGDGMVQ